MTGVEYKADGKCVFTVWAPEHETMILHLLYPETARISMEKDAFGYWKAELNDIRPGTRYMYGPDAATAYPDPASFYQPDGVHESSEVIDHHAFRWTDREWKGMALKELILYELHVGTFTEEGTFDAIIPRLDELKDTGINAIELMPVAQFPGARNWGYDGVYPYAVQNSYGGPNGLKRLVDACHAKGISVFLDVVYNHFGPEGNYISKFGPYFTEKYSTPWGDAINLDEEWADGVREYLIGNILSWFQQYHMDGLRLDAVHTIFDSSAINIWEQVHQEVKILERKLGRPLSLVAESDLNSPKITSSPEVGGHGLDAQWLDDFHHALYTIVNPEDNDRYADFGSMEQLAKAYTEGFVLSGAFSESRKRKFGRSSKGVPGDQFIAFNQNHDQAGNRARGERLGMLVDFERQKLAAAALLLSPYVPMLFMGEEYGEDNPFFYFVSHSDEELIEAVRKSRQQDFIKYNWGVDPPDPQGISVFNQSKISWQKRGQGDYVVMHNWFKELIRIRKSNACLSNFDKSGTTAEAISDHVLLLKRSSADLRQELLCLFNFGEGEAQYNLPGHSISKILDSGDSRWQPGSAAASPASSYDLPELTLKPVTVVVYERNLK